MYEDLNMLNNIANKEKEELSLLDRYKDKDSNTSIYSKSYQSNEQKNIYNSVLEDEKNKTLYKSIFESSKKEEVKTVFDIDNSKKTVLNISNNDKSSIFDDKKDSIFEEKSKSIIEEPSHQMQIYNQEKSVLDKIQSAINNTHYIDKNSQNAIFNIKAQNLGQIGVIDRMAGLVANREDMDLNTISLTETYKDKSLDTKVMGGLYNFTLSDMYKDKHTWLVAQGGFTFGGLIKGSNNAEIETDAHEYSGPIKDNERVFENKTAKGILTSKGLLRQKRNKTNINGEDYGYNEFDENSIEGATIYSELNNEKKEEEHSKQPSMQELIDRKNKQNNPNSKTKQNNNIILHNKSILSSMPIYSQSNIYQANKNYEMSNNGIKIATAKRYKQLHKLNFNSDEADKKKRKKKPNEFLYGLNIDTLKETRDANNKTFAPDKELPKLKQRIDNHEINDIIKETQEKKEIPKINLSEIEEKKITDIKELEKKENIIDNNSFSLKIESNTKKEIPKINFSGIEEKKITDIKELEKKEKWEKPTIKLLDIDFETKTSEKKPIPSIKFEENKTLITKKDLTDNKIKLEYKQDKYNLTNILG